MRSKLSCLTAAMIIFGAMSGAHAADPKKNGASKKKSNELINDNFDKQMSWENNVLGPDDKKAEMAKMARANAMAKAAAEKAAAEKANAERNAAKDEAKQQRTAATKSAAPVLLATPEDETAGKSTRNNDKFAEEPAPAPPPAPVKPADDKFIDKILKGEASKKKVVRNDDELNELLAKDKIAPAPKPKGKRVDSVDDLLRSAEKQPDMPVTKQKTPDWAKIEPEATPRTVAAAPRPQPKKDDGVIHIVQGAAGTMSAPPPAPRPQMAAASSRRPQNTDTFDRRDADPFAEAPRKRTTAAPVRASASFADPFADSGSPAPAPRARSVVAPRPVAPPPAPRALAPAPTRREAAAPPPGWSDPFADAPSDRSKPAKRTAEPKRTAPSGHPPGWKDPFSDAAPARRSSSVVAMSEPHRRAGASRAAASGGSTWGVLKKQSRR
jgi:hypothetical protein